MRPHSVVGPCCVAVLLALIATGQAVAQPLGWSAPEFVDGVVPLQNGAPLGPAACPSRSLCLVTTEGSLLVSRSPLGGARAWHTSALSQAPDSLSCPSTRFCAGVNDDGYVVTSTDPGAGGRTWKAAKIDKVTVISGNNGSSDLSLQGISCPSAHFCAAVDYAGNLLTSTDPTGGKRAWKRTVVARGYQLDGVSCPSRSFCAVAVEPAQTLTALTSTDPTGGARAWRRMKIHNVGFDAITCLSARFCVASAGGSSLYRTAQPGGGASAWHELSLPNGFVDVQDDIDCLSRSFCAAVNGEQIATSTDPLGGRHAWHSALIDPEFSGYNGLNAVACPTRSECVAASDDGAIYGSAKPTAGPKAWHAAAVDGSSPLFGISCPSTALCVTADGAGNIGWSANPGSAAAAWHFDSFATEGFQPGQAGLVTCPSMRLCLADPNGTLESSTDPTGGTSAWSLLGRPCPSLSTCDSYNVPVSLSCASPSLCVSMSDSLFASTTPTIGSSWKRVFTTTGGQPPVSCSAAGVCFSEYSGTGNQFLISTAPATAGSWSIVTLGSSISTNWTGGTCGPGTMCLVYGYPNGAAEQYVASSADASASPSAWNITTIASKVPFTDLACASSSLCVAIDGKGNAWTSTDPTAADSTWSKTAIDPGVQLNAVACPSATTCVAVDDKGRVLVGS
jgi:hypothetical protein